MGLTQIETLIYRSEEKMELICFIIPPSQFLFDERVFMTLGVLKVAAVFEKSGAEVEVLDLSGYSNFLEVVARYEDLRPNVKNFGLTTTTPQLPAASQIATLIKSKDPNS